MVSAAVLYMNYSTRGAIELPTQSSTYSIGLQMYNFLQIKIETWESCKQKAHYVYIKNIAGCSVVLLCIVNSIIPLIKHLKVTITHPWLIPVAIYVWKACLL